MARVACENDSWRAVTMRWRERESERKSQRFPCFFFFFISAENDETRKGTLIYHSLTFSSVSLLNCLKPPMYVLFYFSDIENFLCDACKISFVSTFVKIRLYLHEKDSLYHYMCSIIKHNDWNGSLFCSFFPTLPSGYNVFEWFGFTKFHIITFTYNNNLFLETIV